eukprot:TRINITY_DN80178_c0_g1_i1.p3 TRINITY_DN80178_c0_g1~~TRINITY_DN80178_c0_g1_i1.p3  ORF type:complete len:116 (-),score=12.30 TRINITY_DN80178_c0_g1_i1:246-593(-)
MTPPASQRGGGRMLRRALLVWSRAAESILPALPAIPLVFVDAVKFEVEATGWIVVMISVRFDDVTVRHTGPAKLLSAVVALHVVASIGVILLKWAGAARTNLEVRKRLDNVDIAA